MVFVSLLDRSIRLYESGPRRQGALPRSSHPGLSPPLTIAPSQNREFLALLQGHTSLVGQLQLDPVANVLVTGGSDGRVIVFSLDTFQTIHRLCAHDNSVTSLQFDTRWAISGGNDGRIKLWGQSRIPFASLFADTVTDSRSFVLADMQTGAYIRELSTPCDAVWRVTVRNDQMVILGRRNGKTVLDVVTFRPTEAELHGEL